MNILVVGHNQINEYNRSRWKRIAELFPEANVTVLAPHRWHNRSYGKYTTFEVEPYHEGNYRILPLPVLFPGGVRYLFRSLTLKLPALKPDIIWVYNGPQSFTMHHIILAKRLFAPQAKIVCCTSTNMPTPFHRRDLRWRHDVALRHIDAFSTGTQEVIERLQREGVTDKPILHRVITGADERHWCPGDEPDLKAELNLSGLVIGFVGRHEVAKGVRHLTEALEGVTGDWSFLSLGDGPLRDEMASRLSAVNDAQQVKLLGYVPHHQTPPYYRCMDVLVLFSIETKDSREVAGVAIMEANLCGKLAVVSDLPGPREIAGEENCVVPEGDVARLRDCLQYLLDNPDDRQTRASRAYERALEQFGTTAIARDTYQFFQGLLRAR